jgi:glycerol-3-phosphate acyltransferase PlsY
MPEFDGALIARLIACFLAGSIPFAVVAMWGTGIDIRRVGSGNPGFNNVLRVSKGRALLTLIGDLGKGSLAVWLSRRPEDSLVALWLYGFAVVLGHCYSPWLKFNGGKGIATSAGVMLVLYPKWAAVALAVYGIMRLVGRGMKWKEDGAIAAMAAWLVFTAILFGLAGPQQGAIAGLMTLLLAWRHKKNFQNMLAHAA